MKSFLLCLVLMYSCTHTHGIYLPTDGYEKCKVDKDCHAEVCTAGHVSRCWVAQEECMCEPYNVGCDGVEAGIFVVNPDDSECKTFILCPSTDVISCPVGSIFDARSYTCALLDQNPFCPAQAKLQALNASAPQGASDNSDIDKPCSFVTCQNEGVCINDEDAPQGFDCLCKHGFVGDFCQEDLCDDVTCNNGVCVHDLPSLLSSDLVSCLCDDGWTGALCDEQENLRPTELSNLEGVCQWVQCQNGATCEATSAFPNVQCLCRPGFSGTFCQTEDQSALHLNTPCTRDAECRPLAACGADQKGFCSAPSFTCQCKSDSKIACSSHHDCSEACDVTLGLCMNDGTCDCFHGLPNYFAHMIIDNFPANPPYV